METLNRQGRNFGLLLLCAVSAVAPSAAQQPGGAAAGGAAAGGAAAGGAAAGEATVQNGFSIRETSVYSTYYSRGIPPSLATSGLGSSQTGSDIAIGGSTVFAYTKQNERTGLSLLYTPTYTRRVRYSDWSAFSNSLSLQISRSVTTRLQLLLSGSAAVRNREEFQFNPVTAAIPLGGVAGPLPDTQPQADPATQSLFFGSRILTADLRTGIRYELTPRLSIGTGIAANRTQYLSTRRDENLQQPTALIPQVTSVIGDVEMSYNLSTRTAIGASVDSSRQQSRLQNAYITNARASVQRALTPHWSVSTYGGVGKFSSRMVLDDLSRGLLQYIAGANVTYQTPAHTLVASFDRRIADIYGIGANTSTSMMGSWRWAKPGSRVWTSFGFGRTELQTTDFPATTWRGSGEVGRTIAGNVAITASYSYMGFANALLQQTGMFNQHSVRLGFAWISAGQP